MRNWTSGIITLLNLSKKLIRNPVFEGKVIFEPAQFFTNEACNNCLIDEAWTADWWWKAHVSNHSRFNGGFKKNTPYPKKIPKGGVVALVILASDKTQLTQFQGDKSAWPVYLT